MAERSSKDIIPNNELVDKELIGHYRATMIGGAVGDTLGMPVEGWDREQIRRHVGAITEPIKPFFVRDTAGNILEADENGRIPYISTNLEKGQWTDDTWLSVITARSIIESRGLDLQNVAKHSLFVYEQRKDLAQTGGDWGSFGGTTIEGFENLKRGIPPENSGVESRNPGNAPALKVAPLGLYMYAKGNYREGLAFAERVGQMTHLDGRSVASGVVQAHAIYALLYNLEKDEFLDSVVNVAKRFEYSKEQGKKVLLADRLAWVLANRDAEEEEAYSELGTGWAVTRNYPFTIFMFQKYWGNPVEGMLRTINFGGDCDSTASIYGALAGAKNGMVFPQAWINILQGTQELTTLADQIYNLR